jgi:acyl-CoA synthetase (AMP-forming)/AMP-acid ligase II
MEPGNPSHQTLDEIAMSNSTALTLAAMSARHGRRQPGRTAVICEDRHITYGVLHSESNRTAYALLAAGIGHGARVAYLGRESEHYYDLALACAKTGSVLVPVNWRLAAQDTGHVLRDSQAGLLFADHDLLNVAQRMRSELPGLRAVVDLGGSADGHAGFLAWKDGHPATDLDARANADDPVAQIYANGAAGLPKGVVLANRTFTAIAHHMSRHGADWVGWHPQDRSLSCFPALDANGYLWFMHCFCAGATSVIMPMFTAEEAVQLIERLGITICWAPPALLQLMVAEPHASKTSFRSLRKVICGGSPVSRELMQRIGGLGCELEQAYTLVAGVGFQRVSHSGAAADVSAPIEDERAAAATSA